MRGHDIDWGDQLIRVIRKGTRAEQWLPVSPDAMVWLRLYLADIGEIAPNDPVWRTLYLRGGKRLPLTYDSLRAVFRRANTKLGTNWSIHDLRHTAAVRMKRDRRLSLRDIQEILGHAHLSTTENYLVFDDEEVFARIRQHHADRDDRDGAPPAPTATGYNPADLAILFGNGAQ